ncbi:MAG TPA: NHL repeat-containing protein [Blastocatellia bacterium]|nr:NHL repeat-containing protein [Blastocatellia bacterium]
MTVRCQFCHNSVIVPVELRHSTATPAAPPQRAGSLRSLHVLLILLVVIVVVVGGILVLSKRKQTSDIRPSNPVSKPAAVQPPGNTPVSGAAQKTGIFSPALSFGGRGKGPGLFDDARSIAVDASGTIYVGEYSGGRIQVFDEAGKFITQWVADSKWPLRGMAADRKGIVYVVQRGTITRYEGSTGKALGQVPYGVGPGFDDVTVAADGGLVAAWQRHRDDIVRFDREGVPVRVIRNAVSGQTESPELQSRVAVDGHGNIYVLGTFSNAVFKFSPEGKFITRFGGQGNGRGQFSAPSAIGVDGQGRVYICDFGGVQVFDGDGRYLDVIKVEGAASGLAFNDSNELFVVAREKVLKFIINKP